MADLRERLKALVEEWRREAVKCNTGEYNGDDLEDVCRQHADQLAAILAESESDPHASHGPDCCWRCADDEVRREREAEQLHDPKPVCIECGEHHAPGVDRED